MGLAHSIHARSWALRRKAVAWLIPRRIARVRGLRVSLSRDNWITDYRAASYATKEPETLAWLDALRADDVLFDIGANIGVYSLYAALRHPAGRVVAIEAEWANLHTLRDNIIANGLSDRVEAYGLALDRACRLTRLQVQDLTPGAALHSVSVAPMASTLCRQRVVWREGIYAMTLDAFCEQSQRTPTAIKLDVDGTEADILSGAGETLRLPALRTLLMEQPEDPAAQAACERLLREAGWQPRPGQGQAGVVNQIWDRDRAQQTIRGAMHVTQEGLHEAR